MDTAEIRRRFVAHFEAAGHQAVPSASLLVPDPTLLFVNAGHGAVQALLPRAGDAAVAAGDQRAEVRAHARHRGRRQDHPARHLLRDVRQLQLRRLLQGRRHRAGLGPGHQAAGGRWLGAGGEPALARRCCDGRRRGARAVDEGHRPARRAASSSSGPRRTTGRWACPGPGGPCSEILYDRGPEYGPEADWEAMGTAMAPELEDRYLEIWNLVFMQDELSAVRSQGGLRHRRARCPSRTSTPAWAWSGSRSCCRASRTCTRST